jgi:hypothetical protein
VPSTQRSRLSSSNSKWNSIKHNSSTLPTVPTYVYLYSYDPHSPPSAYLLDGAVSLIRFWFVWFLLLLTDWDSLAGTELRTGAAPPPPGEAPPPPSRRGAPSARRHHNNSRPWTRLHTRNTGTLIFMP